ncbi:MAG: hypothetical protein FJ119_04345 [Deltaproteobacteria bacterium]|nr:hypothetical protein [Deltaproteobacteria bacterium]
MQSNIRLTCGFFFALLGVYILTFSGHIYTVDGYQYYAMAQSMVEKGTLAIPPVYMTVQGIDKQHYSKLGKGQSVLAIPLYIAGKFVRDRVPDSVIIGMENAQAKVRTTLKGNTAVPAYRSFYGEYRPDPLLSFFVLLLSPIITAICLSLVYYLLTLAGYSCLVALAVSVMAAFSTYFWPSSRDFFTHPLESVLLLCTVIARLQLESRFRYRYFLIMGLCGAFAVHVRITTVVWIPIFGISLMFVFFKYRAGRNSWITALSAYLLPVVVAGMGLLLLNYYLFGGFFKTGYHTAYDQGFSTPLLRGLYSNLLSANSSIFIFAPPLIIACFGWVYFFKNQRLLCLLMISVFLTYLVMYSKWWVTTGGWCLGPRFLLPTLPLLMLPLAELCAQRGRLRRIYYSVILLLSLLGMSFQLVWMSVEYTTMIDLCYGNFFGFSNYLEIFRNSGRETLDFWYINMFGEIPLFWYIAAVIIPLASLVVGIIIIFRQLSHHRIICTPGSISGC